MVEVFKTNVMNHDQADWIVAQIQNTFQHYKASFDLDDCDRILVVKCILGEVRPMEVIDLLHNLDFRAEILPE